MCESYGMRVLDLTELGIFHGDLDGEGRCHVFELARRETSSN